MKLGAHAYLHFAHVSKPRSLTVLKTPSALASFPSSGVQNSGSNRRHINFDDEVEQFIALCNDSDDHDHTYSSVHEDDNASDDEVVMMKPVHGKDRKPSGRITPRAIFSSERNTIAMLPPAKLKYQEDTPKRPQRCSFRNAAAKWVSSPPTEIPKPSKPSANHLLDNEDEENDLDWQPMSPTARRDWVFVHQACMSEAYPEENKAIQARGLHTARSGELVSSPSIDILKPSQSCYGHASRGKKEYLHQLRKDKYKTS